jgi:hypothetical protein
VNYPGHLALDDAADLGAVKTLRYAPTALRAAHGLDSPSGQPWEALARWPGAAVGVAKTNDPVDIALDEEA